MLDGDEPPKARPAVSSTYANAEPWPRIMIAKDAAFKTETTMRIEKRSKKTVFSILGYMRLDK